MKRSLVHKITRATLILAFCISTTNAFSQTEDADKPVTDRNIKGFQAGIYVGSLIPNQSTSGLYDGYGFDSIGVKNNFYRSFMYRSIVMTYGGGYGYGFPDQIAQALNVNHGDWNFDQTDMPVKMKYSPAVSVGLHMLYCIDKKNAIILNTNTTKLTLTGNFTITLNTSLIGPQQPNYENIKTFPITGGEKRALFQVGYQHSFGNDVLSFFAEGGASLNMIKFLKNQVTINSLVIDLSSYYAQPYYAAYRANKLTGYGLGAFAGLGFNYFVSLRCRLQLLYNPSLDKLNFGPYSDYKLQHQVGLRVYYQMKK